MAAGADRPRLDDLDRTHPERTTSVGAAPPGRAVPLQQGAFCVLVYDWCLLLLALGRVHDGCTYRESGPLQSLSLQTRGLVASSAGWCGIARPAALARAPAIRRGLTEVYAR